MIFMRLPISKTHACRQDGACSGKSAIHRGRQCPNLLKNHHGAIRRKNSVRPRKILGIHLEPTEPSPNKPSLLHEMPAAKLSDSA